MSTATSTSIEWHDCGAFQDWHRGGKSAPYSADKECEVEIQEFGLCFSHFTTYICASFLGLPWAPRLIFCAPSHSPIPFPFTITIQTSTSHAGLSFLSLSFHLQISQTPKPSRSNTMFFWVEKKVPLPHPQVGVLCWTKR